LIRDSHVQPFSQKSLSATVPKVFQIGLCGVVEADLELICNSWSVEFLGERLYGFRSHVCCGELTDVRTKAILQSAQFWPIRTRTRTHDVFMFSYIICRFSNKSHEPSRYHLNAELFRFEDEVGSRRSRRRRRDGSSFRFTVRRFTLCRCPRRVAVRAVVPSIIRVVTS